MVQSEILRTLQDFLVILVIQITGNSRKMFIWTIFLFRPPEKLFPISISTLFRKMVKSETLRTLQDFLAIPITQNDRKFEENVHMNDFSIQPTQKIVSNLSIDAISKNATIRNAPNSTGLFSYPDTGHSRKTFRERFFEKKYFFRVTNFTQCWCRHLPISHGTKFAPNRHQTVPGRI